MTERPASDSFIQLVDVHGCDPKADAGRAGEVAKEILPDRRILAVEPAGRDCRHGYPLWAVEVSGPDYRAAISGPDTRVAYVNYLSGPPIRCLQEDVGGSMVT